MAIDQLALKDAVVGVADDQLAVVGVRDRQVGDPTGVLKRLAGDPPAAARQHHLPASAGVMLHADSDPGFPGCAVSARHRRTSSGAHRLTTVIHHAALPEPSLVFTTTHTDN